MAEEKTNTFTFATEAGARPFVARLERRSYERSDNLGQPGAFKVERSDGEIRVVAHLMSPKDRDSLYALATQDRKAAGEKSRKSAKTAKRADPPSPPAHIHRNTEEKKKPANGNGNASVSPIAALIADLEGQRGRLDVAIAALKTAHGALAGS